MVDWHVFPYVINRAYSPDNRARPFIPVLLSNGETEIRVLALLDSGADMNVMPYHVGIELGGIWSEEPEIPGLSGVTEPLEARGLLVNIGVGTFSSICMGFAWTREVNVPVILGQVSFFTHFNVCFKRSQQKIELALAASHAE